MIRNSRLSTKIIGGFLILIVLNIIVSALTIYYLRNVKQNIRILAKADIPEASAVVETERDVWHTHVLSYQFNVKQDEKNQKQWLKQWKKAMESVNNIEVIAEKFNNYKTLESVKVFRHAMDEYRVIGEQYVPLVFENTALREKLTIIAYGIEKQLFDYMNDQKEKIGVSCKKLDYNDIDRRVKKLGNANTAIHYFSEFRKSVMEYLLHNQQDDISLVRDNLKNLITTLEMIIKHSDDPENIERGKKSIESAVKYKNISENWFENKQKQNDLLEKSNESAMKIINLAQETDLRAHNNVYDSAENILKTILNLEIILIFILLITTIVGLGLAFIITWFISRPVNRITIDLGGSAELVASTSSQLASSSQSLSNGASEQAAAIQEIASSLEDIASMTSHNSLSSDKADKLMKDINSSIKTASFLMEKLNQKVTDIAVTSNKTSDIVKAINGIAFQTNLLALNAAVEAARAGESGAGFSVVASEVRSLAARTSDAAEITYSLIEENVRKINQVTEIVSETYGTFSKIHTDSNNMGILVSEISTSSFEQSGGIDQINKGVADIEKIIQLNAANAEESASASEQMSIQSENMLGIVEILQKITNGNTKSNGNGRKPLLYSS
ncbi:Methyl-accepting chemotaxis receptor protein, HlyB-like [Desulfonema limicola]|uniref:Methyl-accepting chemotaxis receptor protein, HlyB-like n=1 Tax=Desulfonema limicola TaxID=45656 RepID=A0A975BA73_9BACT|nr:methyl-accepting chemotaxis protein [Desulfonema limicola]QTA81527.1 Methyl-accepting chemotaxis receptor protein, HlyB-like [Desulfonema limicola]